MAVSFPSTTPTDSQGTSVLIQLWVLGGIATLVVALRVIAKVKIGHFRLDDVVMIAALVCCLIACSLSTSAVAYGYAQHSPPPREADAIKARRFYLIGQGFIVGGAALGRAAFVLHLLAILGDRIWDRVMLISMTVLGLAINFVTIVLMFGMCKDVNATWDYTLERDCRSVDIELKYDYFQSAFNTFVDLYLAVVPTWIFWHLNLRFGIKFSLIALMGFGLITMAAALAKTVQLRQMTQDMLTETIDLFRWGILEGHLVVITASLPCLRSLVLSSCHFRKTSGDRSPSCKLRTYNGTAGSTAHGDTHRGTDSRLRGIFPRSNHVEGDGESVDYILGSRASSQDLEQGRGGLQKQVAVSVFEE